MLRKNHIQIYQTTTSFYEEKKIEVYKKTDFSIEKMGNLGDCIFKLVPWERIFYPCRYTDWYVLDIVTIYDHKTKLNCTITRAFELLGLHQQ